MKRGVIAEQRPYYVGFKANTAGVLQVIYSLLDCDSVKPLMMCMETIVVYRVCHAKYINILCRHNAEFLVFNLTVNTQDFCFFLANTICRFLSANNVLHRTWLAQQAT
jgi:hypothetical protein